MYWFRLLRFFSGLLFYKTIQIIDNRVNIVYITLMAIRPKRPCNHPGCPATTLERYCPKHKKLHMKQYDKQRGSRIERGYTQNWVRYTKIYRMNHPLCVICQREGRLTPSQHVDHIVAVSGRDDPMFWEPNNHQALCASCHSKKTATEDGGFGHGKS